MLKEYIRIKKIDLYVKSLLYKYKLATMKETLLKMKKKLRELNWGDFMKLGKHTELGQKMAKLEDTIRRKDQEIIDVKQECADAFKQIYDLSKINDYSQIRTIMSKMGEIAKDNFNLLLNDLLDYKYERDNKIIELPRNRQIKR